MNYAAHYERLIARARHRVLDGYRERHHIVPKCMGGTDARVNLVDLTPEEHYVAHQLLVKMYPEVPGLAMAAVRMAKQCSGARAYGWLRRKHATRIAELMKGNAHTKGMTLSPEHKQKMSVALRGRVLPPRTPEHAAKIAAKNRGRPFSAERRAKLSEAHRGLVPWNKGRKHSAETKAKMSLAHMGNRSHAGRRFSDEHRAKLSAALMGNKRRAGKTPWNKGAA